MRPLLILILTLAAWNLRPNYSYPWGYQYPQPTSVYRYGATFPSQLYSPQQTYPRYGWRW